MFTLFLICAVLAGTIFTLQFLLLLFGFGLEGVDIDGLDFDGDLEVDADGDIDGATDQETGMVDHGSTTLFSVLSFRTIVAAVTMFGLVGMATLKSLPAGPLASVLASLCALLGGVAAMYGVHFLMKSLHKLNSDGKLRPTNAIGQTATVYLPIPGSGEGKGKVQVRVQGRLVELLATTDQPDSLPTSSQVRIVAIHSGSIALVEPLPTKAPSSKVIA